ncbi:hypothetical protein GIB67_026652 [Kingdonia uniflora]|uniref:Ribosomal RNA methyltransferase FtsJ domain-containing protein n=1 Tax=Kingdonia uniflora TaxID=39325 RepID=A0A7J7NIG3_9MAGN|nr:hypothetical protein GIB67_026652 [Kingdonia uniflora]
MDTSSDVEKVAYVKWVKANKMVNLIIRSSINPIMRGAEKGTAKELLDVIKKQFEGFIKGRQYSNLYKLLSYILKISKLVLTLKELGLTIDDTLMNQEKTWEMNKLIAALVFKEERHKKGKTELAHLSTSMKHLSINSQGKKKFKNQDQWHNAMTEEIDYVSHNSASELTPLLEGSKFDDERIIYLSDFKYSGSRRKGFCYSEIRFPTIVVLESEDNIHDATDIDSLDEDYYSEESAAACDEEHNSGDDFDFEDDIVEISSKQQEEQVYFAPNNPLVGSMAPVFTKKGENEVGTRLEGGQKRMIQDQWPAAIVTTMFPEVTPSNNEMEIGKAYMDLQASCVINEDFTEISHLPMSGRSFSVWRDYQAGFECTDFIKDRKVSQTRKYTSLEEREVWNVKRDNRLQYKIDEEFSIFKGVKRVVDLCAAPGNWSQPMAPIKGVIQVQGDITNARTAEVVIKHFDGCKVDLVVCNGAPDITELYDMDEFVQSQLILAGLTIVTHVLREGGKFIAKIFRGKDTSHMYCQLKLFFSVVTFAKPKGSRNSSIEAFAVCENYSPPEGFNPKYLHHLLEKVGTPSGADSLDCSSGWLEGPNKVYIPFLACKDLSGYDSGRSYPLPIVEEGCSYQSLDPVQPPISPPHNRALEMKKASHAYAIEGPVKEKSRWFLSLRDLTNKFKMLKMEHTRLSAKVLEYKKCIKDVTKMTSTIQSAISQKLELQRDHKALKFKFIEEAKERKTVAKNKKNKENRAKLITSCTLGRTSMPIITRHKLAEERGVIDEEIGRVEAYIPAHTKKDKTIQCPDVIVNIRAMNGEVVYARPKKMGMIILGGGLPKHHIYNANMFCNGADYAAFINMAQEFDGSDSGACPDEAESWGKIRGSAENVKVCFLSLSQFGLLDILGQHDGGYGGAQNIGGGYGGTPPPESLVKVKQYHDLRGYKINVAMAEKSTPRGPSSFGHRF